MRTPTPPPKLPLALLVVAVVLALIGVGGLVTGAGSTSSNTSKRASSGSTTTTDASTQITSAFVTVPVPTTTASPLATGPKRTTATTKASTATTQPAAAACASSPGSGNPGSPKPPAIGTYDYTSCTSEDKVAIVVSAGSGGGGVTRRNIETQSQLGNVTAHDSFGPNGVMQESATIVAFGFTLQCDWMPDITEYPANLAVGTAWSADSSCDLGNGATMRATGSRKITSVTSFVVGGTKVTAWAIDGTQKLVITAPGRSPTTFTSTSNELYDPSRGILVYAKAVSEASGSVTQPPTTTEIRLTNLNPKN